MTRTSWLLLAACTPPVPSVSSPVGTQLTQALDGLDERSEIRSPKVCATDQHVHVLWIRDGDVWSLSKTTDADSFPSMPTRVQQGLGHAEALEVACIANHLWAVWEDDRDGPTGAQNIYLNHSTNGGLDWMARDVNVDDDPEGTAISLGPQIAVSRQGVHVAWYDQRNGAPDIFIASAPHSEDLFGAPALVSGRGSRFWAGNPNLITVDNRPLVVWEDTRFGRQDIQLSTADTTGRFVPASRIDAGDPGEYFSFSPQVAADHDDVYAVWQESPDRSSSNIYINSSTDGGLTWPFFARRIDHADDVGLSESIQPQVVVREGRAWVLWFDSWDGGRILATHTEGGNVIAEQQRLSTTPARPPLLEASRDTLVAAWPDDDPQAGSIRISHAPVDDPGRWSEATLLAEVSGPSQELDLTVQQDRAYAVWIQRGTGSSEVFFASMDLP